MEIVIDIFFYLKNIVGQLKLKVKTIIENALAFLFNKIFFYKLSPQFRYTFVHLYLMNTVL